MRRLAWAALCLAALCPTGFARVVPTAPAETTYHVLLDKAASGPSNDSTVAKHPTDRAAPPWLALAACAVLAFGTLLASRRMARELVPRPQKPPVVGDHPARCR
jgi:hypothetical protein